MKQMKNLIHIVILGLLLGCGNRSDIKKEDKPVARVFDTYLYYSDLAGVIPPGISKTDSISAAKDFIDKWVRNHLLLNKAESNLTESEKDVELQIENYRSSLLIYAYQQSYLRQNLDTVVTDKEIEDYYNANQSNFILSESMLKGFLIKIPVSSPEIYNLRQWYRSDDPESIKKLEAYCFKYASVYDLFNEDWIKFSDVLPMLPENANTLEATMRSHTYLEVKDKDYYYFVRAKEMAPEGTVAPIEVVKDDVSYIILNRRKIELISKLETNIYSDAQNHEYFTIYP
jgi:hypothetical protein